MGGKKDVKAKAAAPKSSPKSLEGKSAKTGSTHESKTTSVAQSAGCAPAPVPQAFFTRVLRISLLALHGFVTVTRLSQALMHMLSSPVWQNYTSEDLMNEICLAHNSTQPRGAFQIDEIFWPPPLCCPGGWHKIVQAAINFATVIILFADDFKEERAMGMMFIIADCSGGLLEHFGYLGGTLAERLGTTLLVWPYLSLALVAFLFRPAEAGLPGFSLIRIAAAIICGLAFRLAVFWAFDVEPTTRGREIVALPNITVNSEL
mmetsp:Transcript_50040/g.106466  ORF Transcript_50040/g.106466 Transcript_50040/m.106466 type:complete len:261 (+) Transcript_50040:95-877(+)